MMMHPPYYNSYTTVRLIGSSYSLSVACSILALIFCALSLCFASLLLQQERRQQGAPVFQHIRTLEVRLLVLATFRGLFELLPTPRSSPLHCPFSFAVRSFLLDCPGLVKLMSHPGSFCPGIGKYHSWRTLCALSMVLILVLRIFTPRLHHKELGSQWKTARVKPNNRLNWKVQAIGDRNKRIAVRDPPQLTCNLLLSAQHYKEQECFRETYEDIFYQYGVDAVLHGHVHAYEVSRRPRSAEASEKSI